MITEMMTVETIDAKKHKKINVKTITPKGLATLWQALFINSSKILRKSAIIRQKTKGNFDANLCMWTY